MGRSERELRGGNTRALPRVRASERSDDKKKNRGSSRGARLAHQLSSRADLAKNDEREPNRARAAVRQSRKKSFQNYITVDPCSADRRDSQPRESRRPSQISRSRVLGREVGAFERGGAVVATSARGSDADRAPSRGTSPALAHTRIMATAVTTPALASATRAFAREPRACKTLIAADFGSRTRGSARAPATRAALGARAGARAATHVLRARVAGGMEWNDETNGETNDDDTTEREATRHVANDDVADGERRADAEESFLLEASGIQGRYGGGDETRARLNVLERLPTRTGWTMIGSGVRRVSSGSTPSRPSARRRTRSTRRTRRRIF